MLSSNRHRLLAFVIGTSMVLILGYFLSFRKTIGLYRENQSIEQMGIQGSQQLKTELAILLAKKAKIDSAKTASLSMDITIVSSQIIEEAEQLGLQLEGLEVTYPETVTRISLQMRGHYIGMVKLIRFVEQRIASEVVGVAFEKKEDRRSKEQFLTLDLEFNIFK